ncbi:MAG: DMT family transporter [Promethearchaeota archaeon]
MRNKNQVKGILYGIISLLLVSLQPIVAISRPAVIDAHLYAGATCLIQAMVFAPLVLIERRKIKSILENNPSKSIELNSLLHGWKKKKNKIFFLYIGVNFAIAQLLFFLAYQFGGAINISLAQQTIIIFGLLFGFLVNHEKIKITQIIFSLILLFGLTLAITQGSFDFFELNLGVFLMMITTALWTLAHTFTRDIFKENESTPTQFAFIRNVLSGLILMISYFLFFPLENFNLFFDPINQFYIIIMGVIYALDILFWYKCITHIEVSKGTVIVSPMPLLTALLATILLGEIFSIFHLIGTVIIISSIMIIVRQKKE